VALVPLLIVLTGASRPWFGRAAAPGPPPPRRAVLLGLVAGFAYFTGTLYWITGVMVTYGGMPLPLGILVNAMLVAYLALFPAVFAVVMVVVARRMGRSALLLSPAVWVTLEFARGHLFTGFPWVLLGYSQTAVLPVAQIASVFGVYGVSALVVLGNVALTSVFADRGRARVALAVSIAAVLVVTMLWGGWRLGQGTWTDEGTPVRVALVQGNVAQEDKWTPALRDRILETYLGMTRQAIAQDAGLIVWPESSLPFYFEEDLEGGERIRRLAREGRAHLLVGSDEIDRGPPMRFFNSAFLVQPDGETGAVYRKIRLVPFGEYVPLRNVLFFAGTIVEAVADFSPGDEPVMLPMDGHLLSTAICYEVVYPDLIRDFVRSGSHLLTTITNDAWFGRSSAPYQHFEQAAMRSIETGRYLVRSANTGISGLVDPYGRVIARTELFEPAVLMGEVRMLEGMTVYARIGDRFAHLCIVLTMAAVLSALWYRPTVAVSRPARARRVAGRR
jgi:apolipoprotein N-acyltransferase